MFFSVTNAVLRLAKGTSTMSLHMNAEDDVSGMEVFVIIIATENTHFEA